MKKLLMILASVIALAGCGQKVEVPPATVGKIMTKDGYQEGTISPSRFRLGVCIWYCDKLIILDTADRAKTEDMVIFMPQDKLNLGLSTRLTLTLDPNKLESMFSAISPVEDKEGNTKIEWNSIYETYAKQIVLTEAREYISKYTIAEISSSLDKVNSDLRKKLSSVISERTPFNVRYVGITQIDYPKIITAAQENAAQRREQIQQEEAQLEISKVTLSRELQETQLRRQIELEKAQIEAKSQAIQSEVVDEKVLKLRKLENERAWVEKWDGKLPSTMMGTQTSGVMMTLPAKQ